MKIQLGFILAFLLAGCAVRTSSSPAPQYGPSPAPQYGPSPAPGGLSEYPQRYSAPGAHAGCDFPGNHCLPPEVYLVANKPYKKGSLSLMPANITSAPGASGESSYVSTINGNTLVSQYGYLTRPATIADLQVGRIAFILYRKTGTTFRHPRDTKEALGVRWIQVRITDIAALHEGYIQTANGYRVATNAVRVVDGDSSALVAIPSDGDAHYLSAAHWMISDSAVPASGSKRVSVAVAIEPPSAGRDGNFYRVNTGEGTWTPHAWLTRPATMVDLTPGQVVFLVNLRRGGVFSAAKDRVESLKSYWMITRVVDTSAAYKGMVTIAGGREVLVDAIRVAR